MTEILTNTDKIQKPESTFEHAQHVASAAWKEMEHAFSGKPAASAGTDKESLIMTDPYKSLKNGGATPEKHGNDESGHSAGAENAGKLGAPGQGCVDQSGHLDNEKLPEKKRLQPDNQLKTPESTNDHPHMIHPRGNEPSSWRGL